MRHSWEDWQKIVGALLFTAYSYISSGQTQYEKIVNRNVCDSFYYNTYNMAEWSDIFSVMVVCTKTSFC